MSRTGSTGHVPEDPNAERDETAQPPQPEGQAPPQPVDDETPPTSTPPEAPATPEPEAEDPPADAKPKTAKDAIALLQSDGKDEPKDDATAKEEEPEPPAPPKAGDDQKPPQPPPQTHEALADWSRDERKHTKGSVKQKFVKLHEQVTELQPYADIGREWNDLLDRHKLDDDVAAINQDQVAWGIKSQAAAVRAMRAVAEGRQPSPADLEVVNRLRAGIAEVDRVLGHTAQPATPPPPPPPATTKAEIPAEVQEAVELGLLSQEDAQIIADSRAAKTKPAKPAPAPRAPAPPAPQPSEPAPRPAQRAPDPNEVLYASKTRQFITGMGVKEAEVDGWFTAHAIRDLDQHLRTLFPGRDHAAAFKALSPEARHQVTVEVLKKVQARQQRPPTPPKHPSQTPLKASGTGTRHGAGSPGGKPTQLAISALASD